MASLNASRAPATALPPDDIGGESNLAAEVGVEVRWRPEGDGLLLRAAAPEAAGAEVPLPYFLDIASLILAVLASKHCAVVVQAVRINSAFKGSLGDFPASLAISHFLMTSSNAVAGSTSPVPFLRDSASRKAYRSLHIRVAHAVNVFCFTQSSAIPPSCSFSK